jgi:hypothetical protein
VRATDNLRTLEEDWDVPARKLYKLERFMLIANAIRKKDPTINTIYVATDNAKILEQVERMKKKGQGKRWTFVYNKKMRREASAPPKMTEEEMNQDMKNGGQKSHWEWMFKGKVDAFSVLLDLQLFKQADYIVGSQTSNIFR